MLPFTCTFDVGSIGLSKDYYVFELPGFHIPLLVHRKLISTSLTNRNLLSALPDIINHSFNLV